RRSGVANRTAPAQSSPTGVVSSANGDVDDTWYRRAHRSTTAGLSGRRPHNQELTTWSPWLGS
ncbi:MAG TPA: hypothetical protein VGR90_04080, partial [Acidimicrobiales bacterium]|nr:hypothetical protein [Acidimicrobiales bacterium]